MLSRLADSLYWLGRHVERADCLARMLDYYLPFQNRAGDKVLRALVTTYAPSVTLGSGPLPTDLIRGLIYDKDNESTVAGTLTAARENARGVRDFLPQGVWQSLNVTWHGLRSRTPGPSGPHGFLRWIAERCALSAGQMDQVMSHDEGWQFLAIGRGLERADMTLRMLIADQPDTWTDATARIAINAIGGWTSFLRSNRINPTIQTAASAFDFALLDRQFPRSVLQSLRAAEQGLADLESYHPEQARRMDSPRRIVAQARTALDYRTAPSAHEEITLLLEALQTAVDQAHFALRSNHFDTKEVQWSSLADNGAGVLA